jgi:hypothetical protein
VTEIQVGCEPSGEGWRCSVRVSTAGQASTFDVTTADPGSYLSPGGKGSLDGDVERLVSETFVFLLEREPVDSILSSFDLSVVSRYFPDYPAEIRRRLSS